MKPRVRWGRAMRSKLSNPFVSEKNPQLADILYSISIIPSLPLMEIAIRVLSAPCRPIPSSAWSSTTPRFGLKGYEGHCKKIDFFRPTSHRLSIFNQIKSSSVGDLHRCRSNLESLFCYDKPIPEEIIEKPVGLSMGERNIGGNPRCEECHAKGAVLCATCSGSGLYIDSILESQGILVKVRCLGEYHTSLYLVPLCKGMPFSLHVCDQC